MTAGLAILARAPELGRVKTRLAADTGQERALAIYRALLRKALLNVVESGLPATLFLAGVADEALCVFCRDHNITLERQPEGTLAERMEHALRVLQSEHSATLLIGSDCPMLDGRTLLAAAHALDSSDVVIHPAEDGGFVLYGERSGLKFAAPFMKARLGTDKALMDTLAALRAQRAEVTMLHVLWDVDTIADARRAARLGLLDQALADCSIHGRTVHSKNTPDLDLDLLSELRDVMGDDFGVLVASWQRDADNRLAGMKNALDNNDAIELRHLAHSLKGSSANLGARDVVVLCQDVEFLAADRKLTGMKQRLDDLGAEVARASTALNELLES